jgi:hypothetical protein
MILNSIKEYILGLIDKIFSFPVDIFDLDEENDIIDE